VTNALAYCNMTIIADSRKFYRIDLASEILGGLPDRKKNYDGRFEPLLKMSFHLTFVNINICFVIE